MRHGCGSPSKGCSRASTTTADPHDVQPDDRIDRPAVLHRSQPAEHPDPYRRGRQIREAFIVGPECESLLSADYSQIEMRIMTHLSDDDGLAEAFASGTDFHAVTPGCSVCLRTR